MVVLYYKQAVKRPKQKQIEVERMRKRKVLRTLGAVLVLSLIHTDAADDLLCVDLGGRRIIKKKKTYTVEGGGVVKKKIQMYSRGSDNMRTTWVGGGD